MNIQANGTPTHEATFKSRHQALQKRLNNTGNKALEPLFSNQDSIQLKKRGSQAATFSS